jgi:hypothetical protein
MAMKNIQHIYKQYQNNLKVNGIFLVPPLHENSRTSLTKENSAAPLPHASI